MATNVVQKLKTKLGAGARTNLFRVYIFFPFAVPDIDDDSYILIKRAPLPEVKLSDPISIVFQGGHELKFSKITRNYDTVEFTIINDTNFTWRKALEDYVEFISPWANDEKAIPEEYENDIIVESVGMKGEVLRSYTYKYAFPVSVSKIDLTADDEKIQEYTVTFAYSGIEYNK